MFGSVELWINEEIICDANSVISVGELFISYVQHCKASGDTPTSRNLFGSNLIEACQTVFRYSVETRRTMTGKSIKGLRLKTTEFTRKS